MSHWKIYEPIQVGSSELHVTADVTRGVEAPIVLLAPADCPLTVDQSRELRLQLERAERDVRRGPPSCAEEQDDG